MLHTPIQRCFIAVLLIAAPVQAEDNSGKAVVTESKQCTVSSPYRKDMLKRLASSWHPKTNASLQVAFTISKKGDLLGSTVLKSSGNREADQLALDAIKATKFAPLPEFYKKDSIEFRVDLDKVGSEKK